MTVKSLSLRAALLIAIALHSPTTAAGMIKTDIVFLVDVSGSLTSKVDNLSDSLSSLTRNFSRFGVDARYGLVTYLDNDAMPRLNQDLTTEEGIVSAFANLPSVFSPLVGGQVGIAAENGDDAIAFALNGIADFKARATPSGSPESLGAQTEFLSYRSDAIKNLVVITDEAINQGNGSLLTTGGAVTDTARQTVGEASIGGGEPVPLSRLRYPALQALIDASGPTLINAIVELPNPGACQESDFVVLVSGVYPQYCQNPTFSLDTLVTGTGGNFFDLSVLDATDMNVIDDFVDQFAATKFQELESVCRADPTAPACGAAIAVPVPATLGLYGLGLVALWFASRRRARVPSHRAGQGFPKPSLGKSRANQFRR